MKRLSGPIYRLKAKVESLAESPSAEVALFSIAVAESSFFPIPPDVLLIAMAVLNPKRALRYALICSIGSVLGGMIGYFIGFQFYELIGKKIIDFYGLQEQYRAVSVMYKNNAFMAIAIAGFTPIPYKVFTIAAGAFHVSFLVLVFASAVSRPLRFFLVAGLIYTFGPQIKSFIDKYFDWLTIAFTLLLILGFIVVKYFV